MNEELEHMEPIEMRETVDEQVEWPEEHEEEDND